MVTLFTSVYGEIICNVCATRDKRDPIRVENIINTNTLITPSRGVRTITALGTNIHIVIRGVRMQAIMGKAIKHVLELGRSSAAQNANGAMRNNVIGVPLAVRIDTEKDASMSAMLFD